MNCIKHPETNAIGICCNCGRAICEKCNQSDQGIKLSCSPECGKETLDRDTALKIMLSKYTRTTRLSGVFCIALGISFVCLGLYHLIFEPQGVLIALGLVPGIVFIVTGILAIKIIKKRQ